MRVSIVVVGCVATYMALSVHSIYGLWYLSSDLVYVILFPQLVCVVHFKKYCNTYGSLAAYIVGLSLRGLGGEDILGLKPWIKYPFYDADRGGQLFPFRTLSMLCSFATLVGVTKLSKWIFLNGHLTRKYDIFHCVVNIPDDVIVVHTDPGPPRDHDHPDETMAMSTTPLKGYQAANLNGEVNTGMISDFDQKPHDSNLMGKNPFSSDAASDPRELIKRRQSVGDPSRVSNASRHPYHHSSSVASNPIKPQHPHSTHYSLRNPNRKQSEVIGITDQTLSKITEAATKAASNPRITRRSTLASSSSSAGDVPAPLTPPPSSTTPASASSRSGKQVQDTRL